MSEVETKKEDTQLTEVEQMESARKVAIMHQRALDNIVRLDLRNYLNMLTASGVDGATKKQIKESIERAIMTSVDFGVDITNQNTIEKGKLARQENAFAAHLVRLKENSMLLLADNMRLEQQNKEKTNEQVSEETGNTSNG